MFLLERHGEIVSREQLRQSLWAADTFVDFDHSLSTIINKIREALGDSASNPRFVETLAKRGYRFVQPVEIADNRSINFGYAENSPTVVPEFHRSNVEATTNTGVKSSLLTEAHELPVVPRLPLCILFLLIQVMYLSFYVIALAKLPSVLERLEQVFGTPPWLFRYLL
ncbi:MAG: hypothetical protein NVS1B11_18200 [Terriglobales bacterium]